MKTISISIIFVLALIFLFIALYCSSCTDKSVMADTFGNAKWTLIGPFDEPEQGPCTLFYTDLLTDYGSEATVSDSGLPRDAKKVGKITAKNNQINFDEKFPGKNYAVAYAMLEFESDGGERFFRMGSDDGLRVWINGKLYMDEHAHRSIDPDSNSFRVNLRKGKNRILVKVCQGTGEWGFTIRETTRQVHEAFLAERSQITLFLSSDTRFLGDRSQIDFSIYANPAPLVELPLIYSVTDSEGKTFASGKAMTGERITASIPSSYEGVIRVTAVPEEVQDELTRKKLEYSRLEYIFFRGNRDTVLHEYSDIARKAAKEIENSPQWNMISIEKYKNIEDIAPTLLYLADMIDGKLHSSLVTEAKQIKAILFIDDILEAMKEGPQAFPIMTGYRQMAYISDIDDSIQPYSLYLPADYSPEKTYSLIVVAHGYSNEDYDGGNYLASLMPEDFIIVSVFGRGDMYYQSVGEQDVLDVMDRILERYSIDENRVYLIGSSMGGLGTWRIGSLYADRFAAIAPYCGWTGTVFMENLRNLKTYVVHGDADTTVSVQFDRACVKELQRLGYDVTYVEIPNGSHNAWSEWSKIYPSRSIFDIFRSAVRNPSPEKLTVVINSVRYGRHYWITVNELDTGGPLVKPQTTVSGYYDSTYPYLPAPGRFEAQRSANGSIQISTERIKALSIDLKTAGMNGKHAEEITIDGTVIPVPKGTDIIHLAIDASGRWGLDARFGSENLLKHDGGGVADLFTRPLILVYGTQNAERTPVLEAAARELADWSVRPNIAIGVKCGSFRVKADNELTKEEMADHHLLLFGTPEENSVSAMISDELQAYYQNGNIYAGGKHYSNNGLYVTMPNPLIPGKVIGYFDISRNIRDVNTARQYFLNFQFRLRNSYMNELMGSPSFCPDVFVMTSHPLQDAWSGWFDRYWENLRGTSESQ